MREEGRLCDPDEHVMRNQSCEHRTRGQGVLSGGGGARGDGCLLIQTGGRKVPSYSSYRVHVVISVCHVVGMSTSWMKNKTDIASCVPTLSAASPRLLSGQHVNSWKPFPQFDLVGPGCPRNGTLACAVCPRGQRAVLRKDAQKIARKCEKIQCRCRDGQPPSAAADCLPPGYSTCAKCNPGFLLSPVGTCERARCRCDNGVAVVGRACGTGRVHAARACASCYEGFHLRGKLCRKNKCQCAHGRPAVEGSCTTHGAFICASCNVGYDLQSSSAPSNASPALTQLAATATIGAPCPKQCFEPNVKPGDKSNGGLGLKLGVCLYFSSRAYGGVHYCGPKIAKGSDPGAYSGKGGVDCSRCRKSCPAKCISPNVKPGGKWNGGLSLEDGAYCTHWSSRVFRHSATRKTRYCGPKNSTLAKNISYTADDAVDCSGCRRSKGVSQSARVSPAAPASSPLLGSDCKLRRCRCVHGTPATGTACFAAGFDRCLSCATGYRLNRDGLCRRPAAGRRTSLSPRTSRCPPGFRLSARRCRRNRCHCRHGSPTSVCPFHNGISCKVCAAGYRLRGRYCKPLACACPNGRPRTGARCPREGLVRCAFCHPGFHVTQNENCVPNRCWCGAGVGATGRKCSIDGVESCEHCWTGYHPEPSVHDPNVLFCGPNVCKCDGGRPAMGEQCANHKQELCLACSVGYHFANTIKLPQTQVSAEGFGSSLVENSTASSEGLDYGHALVCKMDTCTCKHGVPARGVKCPVVGIARCMDCDPGFHLAVDQRSCRPNICTCRHGSPVIGVDCLEHGAEKCQSCDPYFSKVGGNVTIIQIPPTTTTTSTSPPPPLATEPSPASSTPAPTVAGTGGGSGWFGGWFANQVEKVVHEVSATRSRAAPTPPPPTEAMPVFDLPPTPVPPPKPPVDAALVDQLVAKHEDDAPVFTLPPTASPKAERVMDELVFEVSGTDGGRIGVRGRAKSGTGHGRIGVRAMNGSHNSRNEYEMSPAKLIVCG